MTLSNRDDSFLLSYYRSTHLTSLSSTAFLYTCTLLSVTVMSLPYAFAELNVVFGSLVLFICLCCCTFTSKILVHLSDTHSIISYEDLTEVTFGKSMSIIVLLCQVAFAVSNISLSYSELAHVILRILPESVIDRTMLIILLSLVTLPITKNDRLQRFQVVAIVVVLLIGLVGLGMVIDFFGGFPEEYGGNFFQVSSISPHWYDLTTGQLVRRQELTERTRQCTLFLNKRTELRPPESHLLRFYAPIFVLFWFILHGFDVLQLVASPQY